LVGEVSDSHLVVDDDRSIALAARRALLAEGFAVDLATDGEEGRGR
jgi:DNA-binding response OmpR family regulator